MKTLLLTAFVSLFAIGLQAQDFEIPTLKLETAEDYPQYEDDIMNCFDWIMETPLGEQESKRVEANKFMITWIMGSPSVSAELNENIVTFLKSSPEMLIIFLGGWTNYALENDYSKDKVLSTKAAINAVITFYEDNRKELGKDKNIEKYIKMKKAESLDDYISNNA